MITLSAARPVAASSDLEARVRCAFVDACLLDVMALKPGNVGIHGAGHGMEVADFIRSARAAAPAISSGALSVGERIYHAIVATRAAVSANTNLGIVLLAAPIAQAVHLAGLPLSAAALRETVNQVLRGLTVADAQLAFDAIRLANPGGLGTAAEHDVREPAHGTLLQAMRAAADRDSIARQYVNGYADIVEPGLERLHAAHALGCGRRLAATDAYLSYLAAFCDSHVARKLGVARAESLRRDAVQYAAATGAPGVREAKLREWDLILKSEGVNPGTSADLTVAALFWDLLVEDRNDAGNNIERGVE